MHPWIRSALVLFAGVVVAVVVVSLMDGVVISIYPLPAGTDMSNPKACGKVSPGYQSPLSLLSSRLCPARRRSISLRARRQSAAMHGLS